MSVVRPRCRWLWSVAALCTLAILGGVGPAVAQDDSSAEEPASEEAGTFPIPTAGPRPGDFNGASPRGSTDAGEPATAYRRIFFNQREATRLVPSHYRPVAIDDLRGVLGRPVAAEGPGEEQPNLVRSLYIARLDGDTLVSEHSTFDITYRNDVRGMLNLGRVNLALTGETPLRGGNESPERPAAGRRGAAQGRLLSDPQGSLWALVDDDSQLRFGWTLQGTASPEGGRDFTMRIAPCAQTRLLLAIPEEQQLTALDGVARRLPSPPPEAELVDGGLSGYRWYAIEAGGLSEVRLQVRADEEARHAGTLTLRGGGVEYTLSPQGLEWTVRMAVGLTSGRALPPIRFGSSGRIVAVRAGSQAVPWRESEEHGETVVRVDLPADWSAAGTPRGEELTISISGAAPVTTGSLFHLPWPSWEGVPPEPVFSSVSGELRIDAPLRLADFESPSLWQIERLAASSEQRGERYRISSGSWTAPPRIRLAAPRRTTAGQAMLQLTAASDMLRARWDAAVSIGPNGPRPLALRIEPNWQLDSVVLPNSGREIDLPAQEKGQLIWVWPEADDIEEGQLRIAVLGRLPLADEGARRRLPPTWFVQLQDAVVRTVAMVAPPPGFLWEGGTAMRAPSLRPEDLPSAMAPWVGANRNALLLDTDEGETPALSVRRPTPAFDAEIRLALDADGTEIAERLSVALAARGGDLTELTVRAGRRGERPPLRWSVEIDPKEATGGAIPGLKAERVRAETSEEEELWRLTLTGALERGMQLVGRRRYAAPQGQTIDLPSVPQASSQQTAVELGPRVALRTTGGSVLRVPLEVSDPPGVRRLRYDPSEPAEIQIEAVDRRETPAIIWEERVEVLTSVGAGDRVTAEFRADGRQPLRVEFDPTMELIEVSIDDQPVPSDSISESPGAVRIVTEAGVRTIRLVWRRAVAGDWMRRQFQTPWIEVEGVSLRRQWTLQPELGSWAIALPTTSRASGPLRGSWASQPLQISPGSRVLLIRGEVAMALAASVALVVFGVGWWLASLWPLLVLTAAATAGAVAAGFPQGSLPLLALFIVPLLAAALLAAAQRAAAARSTGSEISARGRRESSRGSSLPVGRSLLARTTLGALILITSAAALSFLGMLAASAQQGAGAGGAGAGGAGTGGAEATARPVHPVLIPLDDQGNLAGTKVYIPEAMYAELFGGPRQRQRHGEVLIRSAEYAMRLLATSDIRGVEAATIEAWWAIEVSDTNRSVRLPIPAEALRQLEVIVDGEAKPIRWTGDVDGVSIQAPRSGASLLRMTLVPRVETDEATGFHQVRLPIPPIAASQLRFEADTSPMQVVIHNAQGQVVRPTGAGTIEAQLGPVDSLSVGWQRRRRTPPPGETILARRWWIHLNSDHVARELELDVAETLPNASETIELIAEGVEPPRLTSRTWSLRSVTALDRDRLRMRLEALTQRPGPIRLLWSTPGQENGYEALRLPEVRPAEPPARISTTVMIDAPEGWTVRPVSTGALEEIEISRAMSSWRGYRGQSVGAWQGEESGPLVFQALPPSTALWEAETSHEVRVQPGRLRVFYQAKVRPGSGRSGPLRLVMPAGLAVDRVLLGGRPVHSAPERFGGRQELLLPPLDSTEPIDVLLVGNLPLPRSGQFSPPRIMLSPILRTRSRYTMTRDAQVALEEIEPTGLVEVNEPMALARRLSEGIVPTWTWDLPAAPSDPTRLPGVFAATERPTELDASLLTSLHWDEGRWSMETTIEIQGETPPEFIALELPARWTEDPRVEPALTWSSQPAADPEKQLIRILPVANAEGPQRIRLSGRLRGGGDGRVAVPEIELLGGGPRQATFAVPKRLTSDIRWEIASARQSVRPPQFADVGPAESSHAYYEVHGQPFSAVLRTSVAAEASARASAYDIAVFPSADGAAMLLCRLDVLPGGRDRIDFELPDDFQLLAAWSAEMPAKVHREGRHAAVQLNLSRLAQQVVLLGRHAPVALHSAVGIPRPQNLPVGETWVARHSAAGESPATPSDLAGALEAPWEAADQAAHRAAQARSIIAMLDGSLDHLAERTSSEVLAWLHPWLLRRPLTPSAIDTLAEEEPLETLPAGGAPAAENGADDPLAPPNVWPSVDAWLSSFLQRVLGDEAEGWAAGAADADSIFATLPPWEASELAYASGSMEEIPGVLARPTGDAVGPPARALIALGFAGAIPPLLLITRRSARRLLSAGGAPLWLLLLSLALVSIVPPPLAAALALIALTGLLLAWRGGREPRS